VIEDLVGRKPYAPEVEHQCRRAYVLRERRSREPFVLIARVQGRRAFAWVGLHSDPNNAGAIQEFTMNANTSGAKHRNLR
jgi:hypothetical protein